MDYKYNCQSKFQSFKQTLDDIVSSIRKTTFFERKEKKKKREIKNTEREREGSGKKDTTFNNFYTRTRSGQGLICTREKEREKERKRQRQRDRGREKDRDRERNSLSPRYHSYREGLWLVTSIISFLFFFKILQNIEKRVVKNFCARYIIYMYPFVLIIFFFLSF